jgi:serine protease
MTQPDIVLTDEDFTGWVIVLLRDLGPGRPEKNDLREQARADGFLELVDVLGDLPTERLLLNARPAEIRRSEQLNRDSPFPPLRSLTRYWRIDAGGSRSLVELVERLRRTEGVVLAYAELVAADPGADVGTNPLRVQQGYLKAKPTGIDALWARTRLGGRGEHVGLVDVEQAWRVSHEDYGGRPPALICNVDRDLINLTGDHGNASLGVVGAADNDVGIIGIAPNIRSMARASHYRCGSAAHIAEAITLAADAMAPGDVLLVEVQSSRLPTEVQYANFDAIRYAAGKLMVVVEAAGNGRHDLDAVPAGPDPAGIRWWFERTAPNDDSGAILVGAAESALCPAGTGHRRWLDPLDPGQGSNHGSRVHCHAWGDAVTTAMAFGYTTVFGGTSSASAIVAGATVLIQAMRGAAHAGARLSPTVMRDLLTDPALGTQQCADVAGSIGPMPNLAAIGLDPRVGSAAET